MFLNEFLPNVGAYKEEVLPFANIKLKTDGEKGTGRTQILHRTEWEGIQGGIREYYSPKRAALQKQKSLRHEKTCIKTINSQVRVPPGAPRSPGLPPAAPGLACACPRRAAGPGALHAGPPPPVRHGAAASARPLRPGPAAWLSARHPLVAAAELAARPECGRS